MMRNIHRSAGAALALLALTAGVPVLLILFGRSPLDGTGSTTDQIAELPTEAISDHTAFGLLTIAAWMAWALFTLQVAAELAAALGRSPRWRLPAMGPMQMMARRLVVALTMSATLTSSLSQRATTVPMLATAVSASPVVNDPTDDTVDLQTASPPTGSPGPGPAAVAQPGPAQQAAPAPGQQQDAPMVTVAPGDSPWLLAERHLGDGLRWREIWDLNRGRPQPDGSRWIAEDLIRPGWRLCLPADATNVPGAASSLPSTGSDEQTLPPPDDEDAGLPQSTDTEPESPPLTTPGAPEGEVTSSTVAPTVTAPQTPEASDYRVTTSTAVDSSDSTYGDEFEDQDQDDDDVSSRPAIPLLGVAGTLLAVAALRELHRRQARRRTKLPSSVVPPVGPRLQLHREMLLQADDDQADRLDAALAYLARNLRRSNPAQPRVVYRADHRIDVLLDRPDPVPPGPWRAEASGLIWVLDGDAEIPPPRDDVSPLPALVTVAAGDADVMIDIEAYGVVALVGDEAACRALARSIVTELSARSEGNVGIEIVGSVLDPSVARFDAIRQHTGWDSVDTRSIGTSTRLLDSGGWPHTWAARVSGQIYDGWTPTVWITEASDDPRYHDVLDTLARRPGARAGLVVVGHDPSCGLRIHLDAEGGCEIPELNLYGRAQGVEPDTTDQLADLLQDADTPPGPDAVDGVLDGSRWSPGAGGTAALPEASAPLGWLEAAEYEDPTYEVLVRVCGPIRLDGGSTRLPQRETAVAAYIALNGEVGIDEIRDAVWAGADVSTKRVRNVVSTVRHSVGEAITFTRDHRLTAGPGLITDLELIRRRLTHAQTRQDPLRKAEILRGALEMVTGRVCTYPRGQRRCWTWIDLDNWIPHVESVVATVASQLARLSLDLDDGEGACWAARRGIDTTGERDELTILLVRGYELLGDEASARQVIRSYERYLEELGVEELNDDLLELLDRYAAPARHKATR